MSMMEAARPFCQQTGNCEYGYGQTTVTASKGLESIAITVVASRLSRRILADQKKREMQ